MQIKRAWFFLILIAIIGCSDDKQTNNGVRPTNNNTNNATNNKTNNKTTASNNNTTNNKVPIIFEKEGFVPVDLSDFISEETGSTKVYQVDNTDQLMEGPVALGKIGDYMLENDEVKFLIEGDTRNMNPCPWGGNVLDAAVKKGEAPNLDILGEVCLLLNASFTLKPDAFEPLTFGSTSVLAVSGKLALNDFINIKSMIADLVPALADAIKTDTETIPDVDMTIYYILRPKDHGLRIVTAVKNLGEPRVDLAAVHILASGGDGYYFNPLSPNKGFGIPPGLTTSATSFPYLLFNGDKASYALVPEVFDRLRGSEDLPVGGAYLVLAGVAAAMLRETAALNILLSAEQLQSSEGVLHLDKGDIQSYTHWLFAGDGSLSSILDHSYEVIGVPTSALSGKVLDAQGNPFAGARVVAIFEGATYSQTKSASDGSFKMELPNDRQYRIYARFGNRPGKNIEVVNLKKEAVVSPDLVLEAPSKVIVNISDSDGNPIPGRVSILCDGDCVGFPTLNDADTGFHRKPSAYGAISWAGTDGKAEIELPGGHAYRVVVSRGMEWSIWPGDASVSSGMPIQLDIGETEMIQAEIMKVVQTPNSISSDFHIHTISSPDSTVAHEDRVLNFMAEGVDIMVTTDHDIITDFAPAISALNAQDFIGSMIGEEVTTSDLGHFNVFPIVKDDTKTRRGGAIDWGNGNDLSLEPQALFDAMNAFPGEQVTQMNHAASLGLIKSTKTDVLRGTSKAERKRKRLPEKPDGPMGDTGLWSDGFTAMELMNGNSQDKFWELAHWWFTMIGRGFIPTGTATSDTHKKYSNLGGVPRTYVFVDGMTDAKSFDEATFVSGVNSGNAIGTNGPYFTVVAQNQAGTKVGPGNMIAADGNSIQVEVSIQVPEWIDVSSLDYYFNPDPAEVLVSGGRTNDTPITPTGTLPVVFEAQDILTLQGATSTHKLKTKTMNFAIDSAVDGYLVIILKGSRQMFPVLLAEPFAFSNPILIDGDGNGYDNPPLAGLVNTPPPQLPQVLVSSHTKNDVMDVHEMNHTLGTILHDLVCTH